MRDTWSKKTRTLVVILAGTIFAAGAVLVAPSEAAGGKAKKVARAVTTPPNPAKPPGTGVEKKDTGSVVAGDVVEKKVEKLADKIDWLSSLDEAKSLAKNQNKPIFWLQALGELEGEC